MRRHAVSVAVAVAVSLMVAATAVAHHSFPSTFDLNRYVTVTGVLTKVEWVNPHVTVYLDAKGKSGQPETWGFEAYGPGGMRGRGITKQFMVNRIGQTVTMKGWGALNGKNFAFSNEYAFKDVTIKVSTLSEAQAQGK